MGGSPYTDRLTHNDLQRRVQDSLGARYTIQRELGGGGMSRVFVAEEISLGRLVVIKVLAPHLSEGLSADRFDREIRLVARLQHPHIVPLFSTGAIDGLPYYTMPFVEGESLRQRVKREGTLTASQACHILRDIALALEYAHAHGVVHRDIKPDNVLLSGNTASVADFGIARALTAARTTAVPHEADQASGITRQGVAIGTPAYMSPEQAMSGEIDGRTDLYSLGCVAFELLIGKTVFTKSNAQAMIVAHVVEPPPVSRLRIPRIPAGVAELVRACLEKSAADRPPTATEFIKLLDSAAARSTTVSGGEVLASIAVLPFENMSGERDNESFSDGISEEIINALAQINGLRVAGRTSSFAFKGEKVDLATIGEKLNVDTVLEGSVRKSGSRLRVTAQLVKVSDGYHLWSERFDRELTDVFAVQEEIATAIASKLKLSIDRSGEFAKPPTNSVAAYEVFLKGRPFYYVPGRKIGAAVQYFEEAIALDDGFALAHAALADSLSLSAYYGLAKAKDVIERAHRSARRAMELAPDNSDARHCMALWMTFFSGNRHAAIKHWENVVAGAALRTQVRCSYAVWGLGLLRGRWDESIAEILAAIENDPLNGFAHSMVAMMKTFASESADVVAYARRGLELDPASFWSHLTLQRSLHHAGMHQESIAQGLATLEISGRHPWVMAELAVSYARSGNRDAALAIHDELSVRNRGDRLQPSPLALAATAAGRLDDAIALCERAIAEHDAHILWAVREVWDGWEPLYDHPRWSDVRRGIFAWRPQPG